MSEATAKSTTKPLCSECQNDLAETATLPALPRVSDVSGKAANDTAFTSGGNIANESLERLISLAESMNERLERLEQAVVSAQARSPQGTKKKSRSKKQQS